MPRKRWVMDADDFEDAAVRLGAGESIVYARGVFHMEDEDSRQVAASARIAAAGKRVVLVQKRIGPEDFDYLAIRVSAVAKAGLDRFHARYAPEWVA